MPTIRLCAVLAFIGAAVPAHAQSPGRLSVHVTGLHNDNGSVRCGLYASAETFRQPGRELRGAVAKPSGQRATCVFSGLTAGSYAVAVFHAENNETRLETGMLGKPKQGYGFSRNPSTTFGAPSFDAAAFSYPGGNFTMPVQLQY